MAKKKGERESSEGFRKGKGFNLNPDPPESLTWRISRLTSGHVSYWVS